VLAAVFAVAVAGAGNGQYVVHASDNALWATVNVCHAKKGQRAMGVRGHMPVDDKNQREYMRFYAQYKHDGAWHFLTKGGDSGWRSAYTGPFTSQEFGWTFNFDTPPPGKSFLMRGLVKFRWKLHGKIVRSAKRYTSGGHPTGSSPHPHSSANCRIYGPPATGTAASAPSGTNPTTTGSR